MQKIVFITLLLLLFSSLFTACTVREELRFGSELRDSNLGFTVTDFSVACIVTHPELVKTLNISLVDQNNQEISLITDDIKTITQLDFTDVQGGSYVSTCTVCDNNICRSSQQGKILVSIEAENIDDYEFDLPPSFILGTPIDRTYFLSESSLLVSFSCLANDDVGLTAVSLVSDVSGLFSETFIQNPTKSSHLLVKDLVLEPGNYLWTCRATDTRAQTIVAPVRRFTIGPATVDVLPNVSGFDGATTDFSKLDRLTEVSDVIIEDTDFGRITFVDNISSLVGVDLSKGIIITKDSITVNSSLYPQLNVPAKLSFYDIQLDEDLEEANIEKDGSTYSVADLSYENGTLTFEVGNFSTYTVVITPQGGYNLEELGAVEEVIIEEIEEDVLPEEDLGVLIPGEGSQNAGAIDILDETNTTEVEKEIVEVEEETVEEPIQKDENESDIFGEETTGGRTYFNPLVLAGIVLVFVILVVVVVWFIKRKSGGAMLRKY